MEPQVLDLLRLCTLRTVELTFTSFSQQSCIHNHSVYHSMSLSPSPQVSLSDAPFPRRWSVSSSTHWGRTSWLGTGSVAIPGESGWGLAVWCQNAGPKENLEWGGGVPSDSTRGSSAVTQPSHQSGSSRGQYGWNLARASRNPAQTSTRETKHHTWGVGELRFIMLLGPEELTLQGLSPEQRG